VKMINKVTNVSGLCNRLIRYLLPIFVVGPFFGPGSAKSLLQTKQTQSMPDRGEICCTLSSPSATWPFSIKLK
jgi:hypothetical protein